MAASKQAKTNNLSMRSFLRKLITEWRVLQLPVENAAVVLAVSGGADSAGLAKSVSLLVAKKKLQDRFIVAHFDHGLRGGESAADAVWVKEFAKECGFEFVLGKGKVGKIARREKDNLEQAARKARYEFLENTARKFGAQYVLTAHTVNDQAETFLMNLLRGGGLDGLGGMSAIRRLSENSNIKLARPLLSWARREDTEDFCRVNNIFFRHDAMNEDLSFQRVRVRKELIPLLREFNPRAVDLIAGSAALISDENQAAEANAAQILAELSGQNSQMLDAWKMAERSPAMRKRILRLWLRGARAGLRRIGSKHLRALDRLIMSETGGKIVELPGGGCVMRRKGMLAFEQTKAKKG